MGLKVIQRVAQKKSGSLDISWNCGFGRAVVSEVGVGGRVDDLVERAGRSVAVFLIGSQF